MILYLNNKTIKVHIDEDEYTKLRWTSCSLHKKFTYLRILINNDDRSQLENALNPHI